MEVEKHGFLSNLAISGLSAGIAKTLAAPIERANLMVSLPLPEYYEKLRVSNPEYYKQLFPWEIKWNGRVIYRPDPAGTGTLSVISRLIKEEGLISLWRGILKNVINFVPAQSLNFAFYGLSKKFLFPENFASPFLAGGLAGIVSLAVDYPRGYTQIVYIHDMNNARKGGPERKFHKMSEAYKYILKNEGIVRFYRGFWINAAGIVVYRSVYFGLYTNLKKKMGKAADHFIPSFALAWATTATALFASYPFSIIRSKMSVASDLIANTPYATSSSRYLDVAKEVGVKGLFKGASSNFRRSLSGAVTLCLYDKIQAYF